MNVFDFAMQLELDGMAHYKKLEEVTSLVGLKQIFSILRADEQKHYDVVQAMKSGEATEMADSAALENSKSIFRTLLIDERLLNELRTKLDGYWYAMRIETESIKLYEEIAKKEQNLATAVLLLKIAEEEHMHYSIVKNIFDLIAKHETSAALHEFGRATE